MTNSYVEIVSTVRRGIVTAVKGFVTVLGLPNHVLLTAAMLR